jgi:ribonuclease T2
MELRLLVITILILASTVFARANEDDALCQNPCSLSSEFDSANCYDFMLFQLTWPASLCSFQSSSHSQCQVRDTFTIHGLWPNRCDDTWPQFCAGTSTSSFDPAKIDDLTLQLDRVWPDLFAEAGSSGTDFWRHEFDKHGTCCLDVLRDEHGYFAAAIQLAQAYHPTQALEAAGISASDSQTYDAEDMRQAIEQGLGVRPVMTCKWDHALDAGVIASLTLCIDKMSMQAKPCPRAMHHVDTCQGQVYFPASVNGLAFRNSLATV